MNISFEKLQIYFLKAEEIVRYIKMLRSFILALLFFSTQQYNDTKLLQGKGMQLFSR